MLANGDSRSIWERTRERRRDHSRIDFIISKDKSKWFPIKTTKPLFDHWAIYRKWKVNLEKAVEERVAVDWKKLEKTMEDLIEKESSEEEEN